MDLVGLVRWCSPSVEPIIFCYELPVLLYASLYSRHFLPSPQMLLVQENALHTEVRLYKYTYITLLLVLSKDRV